MEHTLGHGSCPACQRDNSIRIQEITTLRDVNAKLLAALEQAEHLFGSVRIEIAGEDYEQANDAAAKGESLCCDAIEEAKK